MLKKTKELVEMIGFTPKEGDDGIHCKSYSKHNNYVIELDFNKEKINYGSRINISNCRCC